MEARGQVLDSLVVGGVGPELRPEQPVQHGPFLGIDLVADLGVEMHPALLLHQVLIQRAAHDRIDELAAPADAQDGLAPVQKRLEQRLFKGGALRHGLHRVVERLLAVHLRLQVRTAGDQQAVAQVGHLLGAAAAGDHGDAPGIKHRVRVGLIGLGDQAAGVGFHFLHIGRNADQGFSVEHLVVLTFYLYHLNGSLHSHRSSRPPRRCGSAWAPRCRRSPCNCGYTARTWA